MTVTESELTKGLTANSELTLSEPVSPPATRRILPSHGWQSINVRELWLFRELIFFLTWRDVKVRYKQTVLGAAWAILQPLLMMVIFTIFFGRLAGVSSGGLPYPLFAYAGLLPWTFFATAISNAGNSVVGSERLISKIYFPRLSVPFAAVSASVVDFVIAFGLLIAMMAYYRISPGPGMLLAPVVFGVILMTALGVGTLLAALNVAYRDVRYVIPFLVQVWMFATPSIYMQVSETTIDERRVGISAAATPASHSQRLDAEARGSKTEIVRVALALNPMTGLISVFRASMLGGPIPWDKLAMSTLFALIAFFGGCLYFRHVEDGFADII